MSWYHVLRGRCRHRKLVRDQLAAFSRAGLTGRPAIEPLETRNLLTIFTVESTTDGGDVNTADGICDDGAGSCTLRAAIEQGNATPGIDAIAFNIGGTVPHVIQPASPFPTITDAIIIDGTTQPGFSGSPTIELDGSKAGQPIAGLDIMAGSTTVRALKIHHFHENGIRLTALGGNVIGGMASGTGNVISANGIGISIVGGSSNNLVQGNLIGTDATGTVVVGNAGAGISIHASNNTIGGAGPARNVIAGNFDGISIVDDGTTGNVVVGNLIGTDITGTVGLGNNRFGLLIDGGASGNTVGGLTDWASNVISANETGIGISGTTTTDTVVHGNLIGTDVTGTFDLGNTNIGVAISASDNVIGGLAPSARNVISGNDQEGINIAGNATGNVVQGNSIGTDVTGTLDLGNGSLALSRGTGVAVEGSNNVIGGLSEGAGNIIAYNLLDGIVTNGDKNVVVANLVKNNGGHGVLVFGSENSVQKNKVRENGSDGIVVSGDANLLDKNKVRTNIGNGVVVIGVENALRKNSSVGNDGDDFWLIGNCFVDLEGNKASSGHINIPLDGGVFN